MDRDLSSANSATRLMAAPAFLFRATTILLFSFGQYGFIVWKLARQHSGNHQAVADFEKQMVVIPFQNWQLRFPQIQIAVSEVQPMPSWVIKVFNSLVRWSKWTWVSSVQRCPSVATIVALQRLKSRSAPLKVLSWPLQLQWQKLFIY